jgi:hypothetical protein|tara:strand:- start:221 stop:454 length:234 start_codon:yes stop_codon:yes gene_type:complete
MTDGGELADLKKEIAELKDMVSALAKTNTKLDLHIDFIQNVYQQFLPVLKFFEKIPRYFSKFLSSEPALPRLPPAPP